mmetsp:Transcript_68935/g.135362  ORF Transcript_68935/g.135362 Transcript_68935/m.135362 type:complete len:337 (+) Transcript_68935:198-1208(+)
MPPAELDEVLTNLGQREAILEGESPDVSIMPVAGDADLVTISSTDFFSPISLDPYLQGKIAAANTLSDLYAAGCAEVSSMLMILASSTKMDPNHRRIVTSQMVAGFRDACAQAGAKVTGGQSVMNPWPLLGGVAISTVPRASLVCSTKIEPGDVLVLTKPLGTQITANLQIWMLSERTWADTEKSIDQETATQAVRQAELSMSSLNRDAARLMKKYGAHGATDITGFGFMGHASNLAGVQERGVNLVLERAPIIRGMAALDNNAFGLLEGRSAETSGGLLIGFPSDEAAGKFLEEYRKSPDNPKGTWGWRVGHVTEGQKQAHWAGRVKAAPEVIEV